MIAGDERTPIRGVIFDLDGTLYTISWLKLTIAVGMPFDSRRLRALFKARDAIRDLSFGSQDELLAAFAAELASRAGGKPEASLEWYDKRFMPRFVKALGRRGRARQGLMELLARLKKAGVKLAVVSDFGLVEERLEALAIPVSAFDAAMGAEELGVMKPTAIPYRSLAAKWGLEPSEVLLVGDRRDQDEMSAKLAGAEFVGIAGKEESGGAFLEWPAVIRYIEERTGC